MLNLVLAKTRKRNKIYEDEYINFNQRQKELDKISEDMKYKQHEMIYK